MLFLPLQVAAAAAVLVVLAAASDGPRGLGAVHKGRMRAQVGRGSADAVVARAVFDDGHQGVLGPAPERYRGAAPVCVARQVARSAALVLELERGRRVGEVVHVGRRRHNEARVGTSAVGRLLGRLWFGKAKRSYGFEVYSGNAFGCFAMAGDFLNLSPSLGRPILTFF
jgi:hypothetical protein